ncbi:hypothetical protein V1514DRAFT_290265 [Lipomyces japonicus]|uniref:uncharacterized protein n=1 Tax=Lipomyces japonicus TaxID=56871 RepID=UPI0034CD5DAB
MNAMSGIISESPYKPQRDYNHAEDQEYKRLRDLANVEFNARGRFIEQSKKAYEDGDGAEAKRLSEQAKQHGQKMDEYNSQAAVFVFRANNSDSDADEIDLHGLYVKEAEEILEQRIRACISRNEDHLEVIVGKGHHSAGGVAKLKPAVERLCQEHGFRFSLDEDNSGVIIIDFKQSGGHVPLTQLPRFPRQKISNANYQYAYQHQTRPGQAQQQFQIEQQQSQPQDQTKNIIFFLFKCLKQCFS